MDSLDITRNVTDFLNIKLKSDAFDDGTPFFYKTNPEEYYQDIADIHKILYRLDKNKPLSIDIKYGEITEDHINDLVELHKEWFPFSFDRNYFKKFVLKRNSVAVGAFLKVGPTVYLIGCALGEIVTEQKFKNAVPGILAERSWYDFVTPWADCGYLHSIGVIDEYRKLSVGTRLLELFIEEMKKRAVISVYLNVIVHNKSAIKFFEANNWHYFGIAKNYYKYNDNLYDSRVYYYVLDMNWCQLKEVGQNNNKMANESGDGIEELPQGNNKGCLAAILGMFSYSSSSSSSSSKSNNNIDSVKRINVSEDSNEV